MLSVENARFLKLMAEENIKDYKDRLAKYHLSEIVNSSIKNEFYGPVAAEADRQIIKGFELAVEHMESVVAELDSIINA